MKMALYDPFKTRFITIDKFNLLVGLHD